MQFSDKNGRKLHPLQAMGGDILSTGGKSYRIKLVLGGPNSGKRRPTKRRPSKWKLEEHGA